MGVFMFGKPDINAESQQDRDRDTTESNGSDPVAARTIVFSLDDGEPMTIPDAWTIWTRNQVIYVRDTITRAVTAIRDGGIYHWPIGSTQWKRIN
jgi:hypothetical protein